MEPHWACDDCDYRRHRQASTYRPWGFGDCIVNCCALRDTHLGFWASWGTSALSKHRNRSTHRRDAPAHRSDHREHGYCSSGVVDLDLTARSTSPEPASARIATSQYTGSACSLSHSKNLETRGTALSSQTDLRPGPYSRSRHARALQSVQHR